MKKTALKATAAALSISMAIASLSFAQQTAPANTKPLPGSKVAAQAEGSLLIPLIVTGIVVVVAGIAISNSNGNSGPINTTR